MKKDIKLLVSDLDGTLLTTRKNITPYTVEAIKKLTDQGVLFTFATGRADLHTTLYAKLLNIKEPIISSNGGLIRRLDSNEIIYKQSLTKTASLEALNLCKRYNINCLLYTPDHIIYDHENQNIHLYERFNKFMIRRGLNPMPFIGLDEIDEAFLKKQDVLKIFARLSDPTHAVEFEQELSQIPNISITSSVDNTFDITGENTSKGNAVRILCDYYGIKIEDVACFGDHKNDASMLSIVGHSYWMSNGNIEVKHLAKNIAPSNDTSGLARKINQDFLK